MCIDAVVGCFEDCFGDELAFEIGCIRLVVVRWLLVVGLIFACESE